MERKDGCKFGIFFLICFANFNTSPFLYGWGVSCIIMSKFLHYIVTVTLLVPL